LGVRANTGHRARAGRRERGRRMLQALELLDQRTQLLDSGVELLADAIDQVRHCDASIRVTVGSAAGRQ
jgi:hypothetical protein